MLKKVIIALQVVILIAVGVLFYRSYSAPTGNEPAYVFDDKGKAASKVTDNDIIVYYDQDSLIAKSNYIDSLEKSYNASEASWNNNLERKKQNYQDWAMQTRSKIDNKQMTMVETQQAGEKDQQLQMDLYQYQQKAEETLAALQVDVYKKMNDAIYKTVKELNTKKKIKFVLAYGGKTQLVTPTEGAINVTSDMVEIINNLYKTKRK